MIIAKVKKQKKFLSNLFKSIYSFIEQIILEKTNQHKVFLIEKPTSAHENYQKKCYLSKSQTCTNELQKRLIAFV
jgi:hypothetical protein